MSDTAVNPAGEATPGTEPVVDSTSGDTTHGSGAPVDAQELSESVDPVKQARAKAAKAKEPVIDDDPEIELDKDLRIKKSELAKQIKRRRELDRAAFDKFQQAAKIREHLESLRDADPEELFKLRGVDSLQFAVERLQREVAMREATPEQRRALQLEQQLQSERSQREQAQAQLEEERGSVERQRYSQKLDKELPVAMEKHGLHRDPLTFALVAQQIRHQLMSELPEDYEAAAESVADTYRSSFKQYAATLKYEDAVRTHPELVKLIRDGDLARARTALPLKNETSKPTATQRPTQQAKREWPLDDWAASGIRVQK